MVTDVKNIVLEKIQELLKREETHGQTLNTHNFRPRLNDLPKVPVNVLQEALEQIDSLPEHAHFFSAMYMTDLTIDPAMSAKIFAKALVSMQPLDKRHALIVFDRLSGRENIPGIQTLRYLALKNAFDAIASTDNSDTVARIACLALITNCHDHPHAAELLDLQTRAVERALAKFPSSPNQSTFDRFANLEPACVNLEQRERVLTGMFRLILTLSEHLRPIWTQHIAEHTTNMDLRTQAQTCWQPA